jgi:glycosyltransferase involved in cell wall biosynthesis
MHIVFLTHEYPPYPHGGVGTFTQILARKLVQCGHQVTVIGFYTVEQTITDDDEGVCVIRLPHARIRKSSFLVNGRRLRNALLALHRQQPIDVIEGPEYSLAFLPKKFPIPRVIRMHGGHHYYSVTLQKKPRPWRSFLERRSFARADALCGVSNYVAEETRRLLQLGDRLIEVIPNSISVEEFVPQSAIPEQTGLVIFTGTLVEKKGIRQLIQAMPHVIAELPQAVLWVVGRDTLEPSTKVSMIESLTLLLPERIRNHVVFHGAINHQKIADMLAQAQVAVYPSHMEAMPVAWLEAMAMGKAVVASRTGPGPEIIDDGINGLLCNPFDPQSIAGAIINLLQDSQLRRAFGSAAREKAVERFSVDVVVQQNLEFYQRVIAQFHETTRRR